MLAANWFRSARSAVLLGLERAGLQNSLECRRIGSVLPLADREEEPVPPNAGSDEAADPGTPEDPEWMFRLSLRSERMESAGPYPVAEPLPRTLADRRKRAPLGRSAGGWHYQPRSGPLKPWRPQPESFWEGLEFFSALGKQRLPALDGAFARDRVDRR